MTSWPTTDPCKWCRGAAMPDSVCPKSLTCGQCGATPGQRCKRPSGHTAPQIHAGRIEAAEAIDLTNGAAWTRSEPRQLVLA